MFLLLLLRNSLSSTLADLIPPFTIEEDRKIGYWSFGGQSIIQESQVMMVPPIQFTKGYAWTNVEIPQGDWSILYEMQVSEGTTGGGFAFWFTDKYGADGPIHGGPSVFRGIGIAVSVVQLNDDTSRLAFYYLHNKGSTSFDIKDLPDPLDVVQFSKRKKILIEVDFSGNKVTVSASTDPHTHMKQVFSQEFSVDLSQNYIGITAQSDVYTSRIDLYSVKFTVNKISESQREVSFGHNAPSGYYTPADSSLFRSPTLKLTSKELEKLNEGIESESDADTVLKIIDELNSASSYVASFKDVNGFVRNTIQPYSQKWHKRTLKIVENVRSARDVMGAAWNYTNQMMLAFNSTVKQSVLKTNIKIIDLAELIAEENEKGVDADGRLEDIRKEGQHNSAINLMMYVSVTEFVVSVIAFALFQIPSIRDRVLH